ncbi:MAG: Holliday junction resolvase RuvX [Legionella sp.]|nr:Holliday junction resolvase RuvX [Legionella sp.]
MPDPVYIGFDFGYKRIGLAVGQRLTHTASPLPTLDARLGQPNWKTLEKVISQWQPQALIVGIPTCIDDSLLYTTAAARRFAKELGKRFQLQVHLVDERLTTIEARERLFSKGGYKKIQQTEVDGVAACIILEQWLQHSH